MARDLQDRRSPIGMLLKLVATWIVGIFVVTVLIVRRLHD